MKMNLLKWYSAVAGLVIIPGMVMAVSHGVGNHLSQVQSQESMNVYVGEEQSSELTSSEQLKPVQAEVGGTNANTIS